MEFSSRTRKGSLKVYCGIISRTPGTFSKLRNCSLSGCYLLGVFQIKSIDRWCRDPGQGKNCEIKLRVNNFGTEEETEEEDESSRKSPRVRQENYPRSKGTNKQAGRSYRSEEAQILAMYSSGYVVGAKDLG